MRIAVGTPAAGNQSSGGRFIVSALSSEPWLTAQPDGRQAERLVQDWSWDDRRTTLRLNLRRDVVFHDGTRLEPELAAQILRSAVESGSAPFSFSSVKAVSVTGPSSIDVLLKEPNAFLLPDLALSSVRTSSGIGTGPFQVSESDEKHAVFKAFPQYYRGKPALSEISVNYYPTQRNAWTALMRNEVDMLHEVSRDAAEFVKAESTVNMFSFPRTYYIALVFNMRHSVLKDKSVRRAINNAFDKAALVQDGLSGRGRPADGPIWPDHWAYSGPSQPFRFNPAEARALLDAAGYPVKPGRNGEMPSRFRLTCLALGDDARFDRLGVLVQRQLADIGVDLRLEPVTSAALTDRIGKGDFDVFLFELAGRSLSWVYEFWRSHPGMMINTGYRSADQVLDRIRVATSDEETRKGIAALAEVLHDDPPAAFLAWQQTSRAVSKRFDVGPQEDRDIFANVWQWRPAEVRPAGSR